MANAKILEQKSLVVDEIKGKFENAKSVVVFDPRGLNVAEVTELRRIWCNELYNCSCGDSFRACTITVHCTIFGMCDW